MVMFFFLLNSTQIPSLEAFIIIHVYVSQFLKIFFLGNFIILGKKVQLYWVYLHQSISTYFPGSIRACG